MVVWMAGGAPGVLGGTTLKTYEFLPSATTGGIYPLYNSAHQAYVAPGVAQRGKLLLFLPGTGASPSFYTWFPQVAAANGFHALNLMYVNSFAFVGMAVTNNCDSCYVETRTEILTGENLSTFETVDRNNSIEHRLIHALLYLEQQSPGEGWGNYLSGTNILWSKMVVAGHSQGAGQAGFIAKRYRVDRALMFSSGDWYNGADRPATWIFEDGETPRERFFKAAHTNDPIFLPPHQIPVSEAFGLEAFGPVVFVEEENDPQFRFSRMLRTAVVPREFTSQVAYHGAMIRDLHVPVTPGGEPVFKGVWEYMLFGRIYGTPSYDGDSVHDIGVFHPPSGTWLIDVDDDTVSEIQFGGPGMIPVEGDYNGDRTLDPAVFERTSGMWYKLKSGDGFRAVQFGGPGMIPVPGDYDGDGRTDVAVYEPGTGTWYMYQSRDGFKVVQFGTPRMTPVPADYDGDGITDVAVYDPFTAQWYIFESSRGFRTERFGPRFSWPVPGDYDGDGYHDLAVFEPRSSRWHKRKSYLGERSVQFGFPGVVPVNRDFDGDGRDDIGVYDPGTASWYIFQSRDGFRQEFFGPPNGIPLGTPLRGRIPVNGLRRY